MNHIDLFSGVGGFALAASWVWPDHDPVLFCEREPFCHEVLKKHWPNVPIVEDVNDIESIIAYASSVRCSRDAQWEQGGAKKEGGMLEFGAASSGIDLLTGGFPCQPFSCAGQRKGASDDRFLWPAMLEVIRQTSPRWIVGENVPGLLSQDGGLVFERVCSDLENEGYEVLPFILPACGQNAPHRRDRIWVVARNTGLLGSTIHEEQTAGFIQSDQNTSDSDSEQAFTPKQRGLYSEFGLSNSGSKQWDEHWYEAAIRTCNVRVDDGLSRRMDRHRTGRLKALGNAIVPQVVAQIFKAIKTVDEGIRNDKL